MNASAQWCRKKKHVGSAIGVSVFAANLLALGLCWADVPRAAIEIQKEEPCVRVREIFITGSTITRNAVILRHVPFEPGDKFRLADLRIVERNLARMKVFKADPPPSVQAIDIEGEKVYKDIRINVSEREYNAYFWAVEESLEFAGVWIQSGLPVAIHRSEEGTFPSQLIRFAVNPREENCPFAINYFLNRLRENVRGLDQTGYTPPAAISP